jgi:hydrogenase maturation protease
VSFDLIDKVAMAEQVVVVDAIRGGEEVGTCTVADVTEIPPALASSECAHQEGVLQILDFVRYIGCDGNTRRVAIAAIEGKQFLSCGTSFSDEVWAAVPRLVDLVLLYVGATVEARLAAKDVCRRMRSPECRADEAWPAQQDSAQRLAI